MRSPSVMFVAAAAAWACVGAAASAQALHVETPSPLSPGANPASVDSFVGPQFWAFTVQPGRFHLVFSAGSPQEGFSLGGRATAAIAFAPASSTSHYTVRQSAQGAVFDGSVTHTQRVVVEIEPRNSPLVRQTTDYVLTLSGAVAGGDAQGAAARPDDGGQIAGVYISKISGDGAVRFAPDGSITASSGARGRWTLFDAHSRLYSIELSGLRLTATLAPGRGLVDAGDHNLIFELQR